MIIESVEYSNRRLVKNEDLNHHKSLFAGRGLELLMEVSYINAVESSKISQENLRFIHCSEMTFKKSILLGDIINYKSKIVSVGKTSITVFVAMYVHDVLCGDGFLTFVNMKDGKSYPHDLELILITDEDKKLNKYANQIKNNNLKR